MYFYFKVNFTFLSSSQASFCASLFTAILKKYGFGFSGLSTPVFTSFYKPVFVTRSHFVNKNSFENFLFKLYTAPFFIPFVVLNCRELTCQFYSFFSIVRFFSKLPFISHFSTCARFYSRSSRF